MKPPKKDSFDGELPHEHESNKKKQPDDAASKKSKKDKSPHLPALTCSLHPKVFIVMISLIDNSGWFRRPCHSEKLFDNFSNRQALEVRHKFISYISLLLHELFEYGLIESDDKKCYLQVAARLIYCDEKPLNASNMSKQNYKTIHFPERYKKVIQKIEEFIKILEQANGTIFIRREKKNEK